MCVTPRQNVHLRPTFQQRYLLSSTFNSLQLPFFFFLRISMSEHTHTHTLTLLQCSLSFLFGQFIRTMCERTWHELRVPSVLLVCYKRCSVSSGAMGREYEFEWIMAFQCLSRTSVCLPVYAPYESKRVCACECVRHCLEVGWQLVIQWTLREVKGSSVPSFSNLLLFLSRLTNSAV